MPLESTVFSDINYDIKHTRLKTYITIRRERETVFIKRIKIRIKYSVFYARR